MTNGKTCVISTENPPQNHIQENAMTFPDRYQKRIRIGAYAPISVPDERHVRELAEAGVDFAVMEFKLLKREAITKEFLSLFSRYGIEITVDDPQTNRCLENGATVLDLTKLDQMFYQNEPCYVSYSFQDEPGMTVFPQLGEAVREYRALFPDKFPFINLLPLYANRQQLEGGAGVAPIEYYAPDTDLYQIYLDEYVKHVDTHYICIDVYPCKCRPDPACPERYPLRHQKTTYPDYVKNLEYGANAARNSGRELWVCIQSCTWSRSTRPVERAELRWQAYTCLSFGATCLLYYVFAARPEHDYSMIDFRGERRQLYYDSQEMALGLKRLSEVFVQYRNLGAFSLNSSPEATPYLEMNTPYRDFSVLRDLQADTPLLVGCFEKAEGKGHAFTLVNMQDFAEEKASRISFCAEGRLTLYQDGIPSPMICDRDGVYRLTLAMGDGVFITVEGESDVLL